MEKQTQKPKQAPKITEEKLKQQTIALDTISKHMEELVSMQLKVNRLLSDIDMDKLAKLTDEEKQLLFQAGIINVEKYIKASE